ncbi:MAG TPA: NYN domain-containing protein [Thermoanaerobaculia bacterium]|nr:NYN domain-containing protein [Thermoanaerobaculia bacterium]
MRQRTIVYIDGFNFYYGCIRRTPYRWLNLFRFSQAILPKNDIVKVKYFTAIVKGSPKDNSKSIRQKTYLRALATIPSIEIFLGSFQAHSVRRPLADGSGSAVVVDMKEKGSDVNLATELLMDAFANAYDVAVIVTNDSDLAAPVRAVCKLGKAVGVLNPHRRQSVELRQCASFVKSIRPWVLRQSLLPPLLQDANGEIHKPADW